jgi:hypothetical protein
LETDDDDFMAERVKEESGILFYRWGATSYVFDAAAESTHIFQVQRVVVMLSKMIFIAVFYTK